jgi:hypothetical protein
MTFAFAVIGALTVAYAGLVGLSLGAMALEELFERWDRD